MYVPPGSILGPPLFQNHWTKQCHRTRIQCYNVELLCMCNFCFACSEMVDCFKQIAEDSECRVVVFSGAGKLFTSGTATISTTATLKTYDRLFLYDFLFIVFLFVIYI